MHGFSPCRVPPSLVTRMQSGLTKALAPSIRDRYDGSDGTIICPFMATQHWALLFSRLHDGHLHWSHFDGLEHHLHDHVLQLATMFCDLLEIPMGSFQDIQIYEQVDDDFRCGTIALAHAFWGCGFHRHFTGAQIAHLHGFLLELQDPDSTEPRAYGPGATELHRQIGALLGEQGASVLIEKVGAGKVTAALKTNIPWAMFRMMLRIGLVVPLRIALGLFWGNFGMK